jgi:hypothetical protein
MGRTRSRKILAGIMMDCYRELYAAATPPADFDKLVEEAPQTCGDDGRPIKMIPFEDYKIPKSKYDEIMESIFKRNNLTKRDARQISEAVALGCSPVWTDDEGGVYNYGV